MSRFIASEKNVDVRSDKNIYDLDLEQTLENEFTIVLKMKLLFKFVGEVDNDGKVIKRDGRPLTIWTEEEKAAFVKEWERNVRARWVAKRFAKYGNDYISIDLRLSIKIGGEYPGSHWQILVQKLDAGKTSATSYVWRNRVPGRFDVVLDQYDNDLKTGMGDGKQTAAAHEFGHMIGLDDEYTAAASAADRADTDSLLNSGSKLRARHYRHVLFWAAPRIAKWKASIAKFRAAQGVVAPRAGTLIDI